MDFTGATRPSNPYVLDATPGTTSRHRVAALETGRTFQDPAGLSITVSSIAAESATVRVQFPGGGSGSPTCIDGSVLPAQP